jgi:regulator of PEP synthase PpsR (kinase-PPPase family)
MRPPREVLSLPKQKVIALTARPHWLESVRKEREHRMIRGYSISYSDPTHIREELQWFREILREAGWVAVDVTNKAIEETASEIVNIVRE